MKTYTMVFVKFIWYNQIFVRFNHCDLCDIYTTKFNLIPNEINRNKVQSSNATLATTNCNEYNSKLEF